MGGLAIGLLVWLLAAHLTPDPHGRPIKSLPDVVQRALFVGAVVSGVAGAFLVVTGMAERPVTVAFAIFAAVSPGLVVIDAVAHRLPFIATGALGATMTIGFIWDAAMASESESLVRAVSAALGVGTLALVWWRAFDGQVGLGDVVLLTVIGGFAGWGSWVVVWAAIAAGFVLAALAAGVARWRAATDGSYLPLGPFLLAGWWGVFALWAGGWI